MKTVFSDLSAIAHLWANKSQQSARNSATNFYVEGDTIFSYGGHFPIAKHVTNNKGEAAVLFTERSYSNTTAKHIRIAWQAASHKNLIRCFNPNTTHAENFNWWLRSAENEAANLAKAKKPEIYINNIAAIKAKAEKYAEFYNIPLPSPLADIFAIGSKDEYSQYIASANERKAKAEKEALAKAKKQLQAELKKWQAGEGHRMYNRIERDYLRMSEYDGRQIVETSQGVRIELPEANRIFGAIVARTLKAGDKVAHRYEVTKVNGVVSIGCHTFPTQYLIDFGEKHLAY